MQFLKFLFFPLYILPQLLNPSKTLAYTLITFSKKADVVVAKNYLSETELRKLNNMVRNRGSYFTRV